MAPFYIASPDRTRESIARVFRGQHLPKHLHDVIRNEIDALLVVLAIEVRMWVRASRLDAFDLLHRWSQRLRVSWAQAGLSAIFFDGLRFLIQPNRESEDRESSITINFRDHYLSLKARLRFSELAEVVEVAERLALFTDEPRPDEQSDEAGELRRALRQDVQLSTNASERCVVRLPKLRRRYFHEALQTLLTGTFLPTTRIETSRGAAAESRWIQIIVEHLLPDDDLSDRPMSVVDRIKRSARDQWREFSDINGFSDRTLAVLSCHAELRAFLASDKSGLVILGVGGSGKTTLIRQMAQESPGVRRTVLVFPLRNRSKARSVPDLLRSALGLPKADDTALLVSVAQAFADREEELIVVLEGLNELGDGDQVIALCRSFFESASELSKFAASMAAPAMRLVLTSRHETYFRVRAKSEVEVSFFAFHHVVLATGREPKPYLEIQPLSQNEREKLFSIYFEESNESGAEQAITRATRRDISFAELLSRPIMVMLAGELYRKGVPIRALRSSTDLVDLVVDHGLDRLPSAQRRRYVWNALEQIFEQRLRLAESDVIKFEDILAVGPSDRTSILLAFSDLSEMGFLQTFLGHFQQTVAFAHDRLEENLLGRYINRLDARRSAESNEPTWYDRVLETCFILSDGKTIYEEALVYHLRDGLVAELLGSAANSNPWALAARWARLNRAATHTHRGRRLARILALSMLGVCSGSRASDLRERWVIHAISSLAGNRGDTSLPLIQEVTARLLEGIEDLLAEQAPGLEILAKEIRSAVRGYFDNPTIEIRCTQLLVECHLQAEDWKDALEYLRKVHILLKTNEDAFMEERYRRAKGIALRNTGHIREAANELEAVFASQLKRDIGLAVETLPYVIETMREFGAFAGALKLIADVERRGNRNIPPRNRLRLALWRGILNKNLMQDAIQFRWNKSRGAFVPELREVENYRRQAEDALEKTLDIAATIPDEGGILPETVQVHSELAETALWHAMVDPHSLKQADLWLEELARLLALRPAIEPQVEYHRYCAQRAALDRRFKDATVSLEKARELAHKNEMRFIEADCDMDWARFIANDATHFKSFQIRESRDQLRKIAKYYRDHVGSETYYPRVVTLLLEALEHYLAARKRERA
jgi:NACHT domain